MLLKGNQQALDFLLFFAALFISNSLAFFAVLWIYPEFLIIVFVLWFVLLMVTVWLLKEEKFKSNFFENLNRNWIVFPFLIFSGISVFWSVYLEISLLRWLILLFTIIIGGYFGMKYDIKEIVKILSVFGIFILIFSAILVFFVPRVGVMNYISIQGAWKGMYWHKNHMGLIATFINILFLINIIYSFQSKEKQNFFWGSLYLFSLLFIYQSDSVAAYFTTLLLHGVILLTIIQLKFRKKIRRSHYIYIFVALIIASFILFNNLDIIFGIFNRNPTLTGRIPMWAYLFDTYISKQPIVGYGFNAFWYLESHRVAMQEAAGYASPIVIADNGFIDILVNTGYVGLFLFSIFYFGAWWRSIIYAKKAKDIYGYFPVILMSFTLLANVSWSLIFENESFFMLIMIAVLFSITRRSLMNRPT